MKDTGLNFMEHTKYNYAEESDQQKGLPQPPLEVSYNYKGKIIDLLDPSDITVKDIGLRESIEGRRSLRVYKNDPITLEELTFLLWCAQGVKEIRVGKATLRNVPSAGARHAFEVYFYAHNVKGLPKGLYRYIAIENKLIEISSEEGLEEKLVEALLGQSFVAKGAVTFILAAETYRMYWRYGERGYRYLHLDAGHVAQNIYLASEAVDCGTCAIAAFEDDDLNKLLKLDGKEQFAIYAAAVGKR